MNTFPKILYGGDYNPDQWPRDVWDEDMRLFKLADIDVATVNVFSWARNQPSEDEYDFAWLDDVLDKLHENGVAACLATSTAMYPAWMATRHPDILSVDFAGRKRKYGARHNACPNSPTYRKYALRMAHKLAERYKDHPALLFWHVNNEYGCQCYCDNCAAAFRVWLQKRYGTLDALNHAWNTSFWSHIFYDWDEIVLPNLLTEHLLERRPEVTFFQTITIDYYRFNSDSVLDCYIEERDAIRAITPDIPITSNLHGHATYMPLDYFKWANEMDVIAWDNYPALDTPRSTVAFRHDLMRGLKHNKPYLLLEQTPSMQNWQPYNSLKRPGVLRLQSYQAIAHGAESIMYFQLRRSRGASEKLHGAVIDHVGHEHTRVFRECAELGGELRALGDKLLNSLPQNKVGVLFDWQNWWGINFCSGPSVALNYVDQVQTYYNAFYDQNIPLDVIGVETPLDQYEVIVAPTLYMVLPGYADKLKQFVARGGTLLTTYFSGIVDENDLVTLDGYPGELRELVGVWVEETDALFPDQRNKIVLNGSLGELSGAYECGILCDVMHAESAEILATYGEDFYAGSPVLTRNAYGEGSAYYLASAPEDGFLRGLVRALCADKGIMPLLETDAPIEITKRLVDGRTYTFLLNHSADSQTITLPEPLGMDLLSGETVEGETTLSPYGVMICES